MRKIMPLVVALTLTFYGLAQQVNQNHNAQTTQQNPLPPPPLDEPAPPPPPPVNYPNLLSMQFWTVGQGGAPTFNLNGSSSENRRILAKNHIGETVVV